MRRVFTLIQKYYDMNKDKTARQTLITLHQLSYSCCIIFELFCFLFFFLLQAKRKSYKLGDGFGIIFYFLFFFISARDIAKERGEIGPGRAHIPFSPASPPKQIRNG